MKIYVGSRNARHTWVLAIEEEGDSPHVRLDPRLDIANHSPTGLEWGYMGSGPSQLAIALIADATGDDEIAKNRPLCQQFKRDVIAHLPMREWILPSESIRVYVDSYLGGLTDDSNDS